jgi:Flp pilus assembly protein TadG
MKPRRASQRGQALPESLLTLPLVLLLGFALLQVGWVLWLRVLLQHAAQSAARAYTVWLPRDADEARTRAQRAAQMALGPSWSGAGLQLDIQDGAKRSATASSAGDLGVHQLTLRTTVTVPGPLGRHWDLRADSAILREDDLPDATEGE